jgi:glycosyltransferase involved in cell wall biosynthesis
MKQLIIWHTPEPSSAAARYIDEMFRAFTADGVPMDLVCPENFQFREEMSRNPLITLHLARARSNSLTRGLFAKLWTNAAFLLSSCSVLARTGKRNAIVHFQHVLHFPFCALFFAAALSRGCKIIFTVHDPVPHKWLLPNYLRWLERGSLAWAYRVSHTLIVHSDPGKRALIEHFAVNPEKISVIGRGPYGLGAGVIPMPDSPNLELLLFGSIRENKGVHLAIEAVQSLHREGVSVRLTIAGNVLNGNEAQYWERCSELIASRPEPIRVLKEFIPDERLPKLFAECHCVLLPYTQFFSDSGVAFMALANGRPIISTRSGGLGPLLDAADLGIEIEEPSTASVIAAIREATRLGTTGLIRKGNTGANYVNVECGWSKFAATTRDVYMSYAGAERGVK